MFSIRREIINTSLILEDRSLVVYLQLVFFAVDLVHTQELQYQKQLNNLSEQLIAYLSLDSCVAMSLLNANRQLVIKVDHDLEVESVHVAFVDPTLHSPHANDILHVVHFHFTRVLVATATQVILYWVLRNLYRPRPFVENCGLYEAINDKEVAKNHHEGYDCVRNKVSIRVLYGYVTYFPSLITNRP